MDALLARSDLGADEVAQLQAQLDIVREATSKVAITPKLLKDSRVPFCLQRCKRHGCAGMWGGRSPRTTSSL